MEKPGRNTSNLNKNHQAEAVVGDLAFCLEELDDLGAGIAAVHVATAIDILRRDYGLRSKAPE